MASCAFTGINVYSCKKNGFTFSVSLGSFSFATLTCLKSHVEGQLILN